MAGDDVVEQLILAVEAMGLPEAAASVDALTGSVDDLAASIDRADVAVGGGEAEAAGKGGLMGALTSMKTLFAGLGIYEAVKQFSGFQSQMEKLYTQTGATQGEVSKMSSGILSMAASVGTGPQSLAEAMYHVQSAGIRGAQALKAVEIAAKGAQIGGAELTATTEAMTAVMLAGFKGVHNLSQGMGMLNSIVGAGDMTMEDLNQSLGKGLLASMKNLGLQLPDVGAALAVFGDNNIRGAKAATALQEGLYKLLTPSKEVQESMAKLGLTHLQLAEDLHKPNHLLFMLEELQKHLKGVSNVTERASITAGIFGSGRTASGMLTLMNQMDLLKRAYKEIEKGGKNFNSDWKATTHTLSLFIDQVKALGEVALIKLGGAIDWVIEKFEGFVEACKKGKLWAEALGTALGLYLVAVIGGELPAAIGTFGKALDLLLITDPWVLAAIAIGTVLILLALHFKQVKAVAVDAWHWIETAAQNAWTWIKDHWPLLVDILTGPIGVAVLFVVKNFGTIEGAAQSVWNWLKGAWHTLKEIVVWPFEQGAKLIGGVFNWIVKHVEWAVSQIEKLLGKVLGPIGSVAHFAGGLFGGAGNVLGSVTHLFGGLVDGGPVSASGSYLVGERGPEIVYLPGGSYVQPNHELGQPLGGSSNGQPSVLEATLINVLDGKVVSKSVVRQGLMAQSCMK